MRDVVSESGSSDGGSSESVLEGDGLHGQIYPPGNYSEGCWRGGGGG